MTFSGKAGRDESLHDVEEGLMTLECVVLRNLETNATARIAVGLGFNCFDFTVWRRGQPIQVLWSAPDFLAGTARPSSSGIPILFPFPGRIHGTVLRWQGQDFQLQAGDRLGNAIHGFVMSRAWRIVEQNQQRVVGEFHAGRDDPTLLAAWPADFRIRVAYEMGPDALVSLIEVSNPDSKPLPYGFGTHPYFRIPLGGPDRDRCVIRLPVTQQWELREMIVTGKRLDVDNASALQHGLPFGELQLDNVFTGLVHDGKFVRSQIHDPKSQVAVEQSFDASFRECVVFTPPHREAICIEPYTCAPSSLDLAQRGIDAGLQILNPGETKTYRIDIRVT
jgi:aldose 1-epimerase